MLTLLNIQDYMSRALRGETSVSPASLSEFTDDCNHSAKRQLTERRGEYRIRMSGLGRPLCQQVLDKQGIKESMQYNTLFRFMFGDMVESLLMLVMREAGVDIVDSQRQVELELGGQTIKGTLDVIIRDELGVEKVWDIKSASDWAYKNKFTGFGGYDSIKDDDPFGYVMQGYLYSAATSMPFGGWIVVNKSSGEVAVVEAPEWQDDDREAYLADAVDRVKFLTNPSVKPFKPFPDEYETYRRKGETLRTENKVLSKECNLCGYRNHCWPKAILHPKVTSQAKNPPMVWYTKLKQKEL